MKVKPDLDVYMVSHVVLFILFSIFVFINLNSAFIMFGISSVLMVNLIILFKLISQNQLFKQITRTIQSVNNDHKHNPLWVIMKML